MATLPFIPSLTSFSLTASVMSLRGFPLGMMDTFHSLKWIFIRPATVWGSSTPCRFTDSPGGVGGERGEGGRDYEGAWSRVQIPSEAAQCFLSLSAFGLCLTLSCLSLHIHDCTRYGHVEGVHVIPAIGTGQRYIHLRIAHFFQKKNDLPQAGLEPATHCIPCSCPTSWATGCT